MANPAFVQQVQGVTSSSLNSITSSAFGSSTTSGNTILVFQVDYSPLNVTKAPTDSFSNTYSYITSLATTGTHINLSLWASQNINGGAAHTITVTDTATSIVAYVGMEISGLPPTGSIIDVITTPNGATLPSPLTITFPASTNHPTDLLIYAVASYSGGGAWTAGLLGGSTGQNITSNANTSFWSAGMGTETQSVTSEGIYSGTITCASTGQPYAAILVALSNININKRYTTINNFQFSRVLDNGNGVMSVTEKIR